MFFDVLRDLGRPHWVDILLLVKRSTGRSVAELAEALGMSYMGVKQHCVEMERLGYLDTWRRAKEVGRPEKAYRLTPKVAALFPAQTEGLALELLAQAELAGGRPAAEKLLFAYLQKREAAYAARLEGEGLARRAQALAREREADGYLCACEEGAGDGRLRLVEYHQPLGAVAEAYPNLWQMEEKMIGRLLGVGVQRREEVASGLRRVVYELEAG